MTVIDRPPAPMPGMDPRLRQRWIDVRRQEGRRRLHLLVGLVALLVILAAGFGALHSPLLKVRHVRVVIGDVPAGSGLTSKQIATQAGLARERLMIDVATGSEARLIEQLPWVASAHVEREWPGTIRITVTARRPVAEVDRLPGQPASGVAVLDATGRVLSLLPPGSPAGGSPSASGSGIPALPLLDSLPAPGTPGTSIPAGAGGRAAAEELATAAALPPALQRRVSTVTIAANGLQLRVGSTMVLFGDSGELTQKVTSLETVVSEVPLAGVRVVDLRVPDRPALTRSPPTASLSTTAGG